MLSEDRGARIQHAAALHGGIVEGETRNGRARRGPSGDRRTSAGGRGVSAHTSTLMVCTSVSMSDAGTGTSVAPRARIETSATKGSACS